MSQILAARIQERRRILDMSQLELAYKIKKSLTQIVRYEKGENSPTGDVLIALSQVLEVSTDYLLGVTTITDIPGDKETVMTKLGARIKARRVDLQMTQLSLAHALNVAPSQIYRYERGENDPSSSMLLALSRALCTTPNYLTGVSDDPTG